jgi:hypothetical protein
MDFDAGAYPQALPYDESYGYDNDESDYPRYSREPTPSSPSPRPLLLQQTPARASTPSSVTSERHRRDVLAKYAGNASPSPSPQRSSAMTPPSTSKSRHALLRSQTEPKPRSPLAKEYLARGGDEGLGTSPISEDLDGQS